jgi:hypothetical protein
MITRPAWDKRLTSLWLAYLANEQLRELTADQTQEISDTLAKSAELAVARRSSSLAAWPWPRWGWAGLRSCRCPQTPSGLTSSPAT